MIILIIFALLAGIVTVLSPCILPVLPLILTGSVGEGKSRPLGVVAGFILSFTLFTLFLATLVRITSISAETLRNFSVVVIIVFGISLLLPKFQLILEQLFSKLSNLGPTKKRNGFGGGFVIGLSLGLLWTPCVGPILASVISLAISGSVNTSAFFITLAYSLGTGLPMLGIIYGSRKMINNLPLLVRHTNKIQQVFGAIMILTGIAIWQGWDRDIQAWILNTFPNYSSYLTGFEENTWVKEQLEKLN